LQVLHNDEQFDYCVDVTALHYPQREKKEFDLIWILYSYARNERIRVKTQIADWREHSKLCSYVAGGELAGTRSLRHVWPSSLTDIRHETDSAARIVFWTGNTLRKDYGICSQTRVGAAESVSCLDVRQT